MSTYKLIHLVRKVGPTSMPWNDLYGSHLNINKFAAGFVFEISREGKQGINKDVNTKRNFFRLRFLNAFFALMKINIRSKRKKYILIIHIHNMSLIPYALCLKLFGIKSVLNVHNSLVNYNFLQRNLFNFGAKYFDSIIPVSECVGIEVIKKYPKLIHKVEPIRNGIHVKLLDQINSLESFSKKDIDVIIIARFVEQKNIFRVINVLSCCQHLDKAVWFGIGPHFDKVEALIENKNMSTKVNLKGLRSREVVLDAINRSKVFLSLSKWEGLGVANIEALALPTEVILSKIDPHIELKNGNNLTICDLEKSNIDIASIIDQNILHIQNRESFLIKRASQTRKDYDLHKKVNQYIDVYRSLTVSS